MLTSDNPAPPAGCAELRLQERLQRTLTGFLAAAAAIAIVAIAMPGFLRPEAWARPTVAAIVVGCLAGVVLLRRFPLPAKHFLPVALVLDAVTALGSTTAGSHASTTFCLAALSSITLLTAYQGSRRALLMQMAGASVVVLWRAITSLTTVGDATMYLLWSEFGLVVPAYALYLVIGDLVGSLRAADYFAGHDVLTGLLNRHGLAQAAPELVAAAVAGRRPLGAVMCDLDRFKRLNDTFGHAAGDEALRRFADVLRAEAGSAVAVRLGGEEFAVLQPGPEEELRALGERIRTVLHEAGAQWSLTVSIGVAVEDVSAEATDPDVVVWSLLAAADEAVYAAKAGGRDQVCLHRPVRPRRVRGPRHVVETRPS